MDPRLARRRGDADRDVLDRAAEAAHRVPLEVRQHDREIVVQKVFAHVVLREVPSALDRKRRFALGVHDVDRGDGGEAVVGSRFEMVGRAGASAAVGGVALDDRAADLAYQRCDERRLQEVVSARFARREFDGHPPRGFAAERFVDAHQRLGRDRARQVDLGIRGLLLRRVVVRAGPPSAGACAQCQRQECRHPDSFHRIVEFRFSFSRLGNSSKLDCTRLNEKVRFFDRFRRLRAQVRRRLRFRHCKNSASALPVRYTDHGLSYHYYGCRVKTEKMRNFAKVSKCRDHGERIETGSCRTV